MELNLLTAFGVSLLMALPLLAISRAVRGWENRYRDPLAKAVSRPAGYGCRERSADCLADATMLSGVAIGMLSMLFMVLFVIDEAGSRVVITVFVVGFVVWASHRIRRSVGEARRSKLGYLGELAVAEALAELPSSAGWRVFHDVRMQGLNQNELNIDHVAVGPNGVFAIETKTWSKSREQVRRGEDLVVAGDRVSFPERDGRPDKFPLGQAKAAACTLAEALQEVTDHRDFVNARVVTPGWTLYYKGRQNRDICEVGCLASFLEKTEGTLPEARRAAIVDFLDAHCRDLRFEKSENFLSAHRHDLPQPSKPLARRRTRRPQPG